MRTVKCNYCGGTGITGFALLSNDAVRCGYCNGTGRQELSISSSQTLKGNPNRRRMGDG